MGTNMPSPMLHLYHMALVGNTIQAHCTIRLTAHIVSAPHTTATAILTSSCTALEHEDMAARRTRTRCLLQSAAKATAGVCASPAQGPQADGLGSLSIHGVLGAAGWQPFLSFLQLVGPAQGPGGGSTAGCWGRPQPGQQASSLRRHMLMATCQSCKHSSCTT